MYVREGYVYSESQKERREKINDKNSFYTSVKIS